MILVIDNYDSFTYNLVHYIGEYGHEVLVKRNDICWSLNLNEGIDLSIFLFGKFENSIIDVAKYLVKKKKNHNC